MRLNTIKFVSLLLMLTLACVAGFGIARSEEKENKKISLRKPDIVDLVFVNYNNWSYVMRNNGSYMNDGLDNNRGGGEFPRGSGGTLIHAGGFYIGTIKNGIPVVSEVEYNSEFQPGRITNSHVSFDQLTAEEPSLPSQKVYLIDRDRHTDWPDEALHDAFGRPALIADAQTWAVFNDLDTSLSSGDQYVNPNPGLGIEVTLESYAFNGPKIGDTVYLRFIFENKTNSDYPQTYFGAWSDADVGYSDNDIIGTDTTRNMEYVYNLYGEYLYRFEGKRLIETPNDKAVGFDIMQGPIVEAAEIPTRDFLRNQNNKTIRIYDPEQNRFAAELLTGDRIVLGAVTTTAFTEQYGYSPTFDYMDPTDDRERYDLIRGVHTPTGTLKSGCGLEDYFVFRGRPFNLGDCVQIPDGPPIPGEGSANWRILIGTGPFTIKAGCSQEIWIGIVGASGIDRYDALLNLFATDDIAQSFFDAGFPAPVPPEIPYLTVTALDGRVVLIWQNNAEASEDLTGEMLSINTVNGYSADYVKNDFQGYRVYRSLTGLDGSFQLLAQYDKVDSLSYLSYGFLNTNNLFEIASIGLGRNTGLSYTFVDSNLTNGQNYFYSVTAYDAQPYIVGPDSLIFNGKYIPRPAGIPVSLESSVLSNAISVVPFKSIASSVKNIKVVPNPFYKYSSYETSLDKLIKFTNLPSSCTIKIFTVAGDLVRTLNHNSASDNDRVNNRPYDESYSPSSDATSIERWDLKTANGRYVASGMYIALIESSVGKKLVKFAIIQ